MNTVSRPEKDAPAVVTEEEFAKFCEFFYRKTGLHFTDKKRYFVERRIQERMQKTGSLTFREYFSLVRFQASGEELQALVNALTVNETYFFREDYQFTALVKGVLPDVARTKKPGDAIRIWSIPCATGEEPYSIAIYILDRWARSDEFDIEIMASDIDSRVLRDAKAGVYGERALQRLSKDERERYFVTLGQDRFKIRDELRDSIDFTAVNVVDPVHMRRYRGIDVIFCRNLLIYFDDVARRETVEAMYECLMPGGYICLGHSESMSRMSGLFRPKKFGDVIVYQKPLKAE